MLLAYISTIDFVCIISCKPSLLFLVGFCSQDILTRQSYNPQINTVLFLSNVYAFYFLPYCNRQKFQHSLCIELVRVDIFALFLTLRREHSFFYYASYNFFTDFLFQAGNFAFYFSIAKRFYHDNCWNVSSDFSPLTEMIICIFCFCLVCQRDELH